MISASSIRFQLLLSTAVAASLALPPRAAAQNLPQNGSFVGPTSSFTETSGNTMTVRLQQQREIINWESFDIGNGYTVDFDGDYYGGVSRAVLNRVVGFESDGVLFIDQSDINGSLLSDSYIDVFLINRAGILFGAGASVDVGSFVASTLDVDDDDFLAGGDLEGYLNFRGTNADPDAIVSTGITVANGAEVTTNTGPLALIGAFINVQAGGSVSGETDVGLIAGNWVRIPSDPGSRTDFLIRRPTPVENAITIAGDVSGRNVTAFMETADDAQNALLLVTDTGSITATKNGGGDIILAIGARTSEGAITNSPGGIRNNGSLDATFDVVLAGEHDVDLDLFYPPKFVENNGSITAGDDVYMEAWQHITNAGTIIAGDDVTLAAFATVTANSPASDVQITNDGEITAGGDVLLFASLAVTASAFSETTPDLNVEITNSGTIAADGDVTLSAQAFNSALAPAPDVRIANSGTISAGGDVLLSAEAFMFESQEAPNVQITNSGTITAGGDVGIFAHVTVTEFALSNEYSSAPSAGVTNSGNIAAGGDVRVTAGIYFSDTSLGATVLAAPDVQITNSGSIEADGDVSLLAGGQIVNSGDISGENVLLAATAGTETVTAANSNITNSGTIIARGRADIISDGSITNSGVIDAGAVANLDAAEDIDNSGSISAGGDAVLTAGGDILDSSGSFAGSISGADVALSAGGSITAGTVTARDDIAIRAPGTVTTLNLTSGATIGSLGPVDIVGAADELLPGVDLSGHDVDVDGSAIAANVIRAIGTGSDIRLRAPVTATRDDLDFAAGGDITIEGSASGVDVAMDAGGTITAGDISARDDIALRAGDTLDVGTLQSGVPVGSGAAVDQAGSADALLGTTLTGHDLFVQGGTVSLTQANANGTNSDLTVRATTGDLSIDTGTAGGTITLTKEGTTGILTAGTLLAGTGATLTSDTDIDAQIVETVSGDLAFTAGRDVTVHSSLEADDVAIDAGRNIAAGNISARDDIAVRAGGTLAIGTLGSGLTIGGTGPIDTAGAADALLGQTLGGHDISVEASSLNLTDATANGAGSDLTLRATTGDLSIDNGVAGGNVDLDAANLATVGTILAQAGNVNILADDLDILGAITGSQVSITNRTGGNAVTVLGDASAAGAFTLTGDELNRIDASVLTVDSLDQNLLVGNVAFDNDVGSSRINLLGTARVDIIGEIDASGVTRTLQIGGTDGTANPNDPSTLASIIRIAPTTSGGGRIILGDGALDLRGVKIGVGLDDGFLNPLGLAPGGSPVSTDVVQNDWIGNLGSTLYGIPGGYADPVVISAGTITVTYTDYALFQNTGTLSRPSGVNAGTLTIVSSGDEGNGFELFGTIDQVGGVGAALLVQPQSVSMGNSRVNGCLIVTGGGCGGSSPTDISTDPLTFNATDPDGEGSLALGGEGSGFAGQELVSTDEDQAFDFDSLVGTNNEGLLGVLGGEDANAAEQCAPDDKREVCRVKEKANEQ